MKNSKEAKNMDITVFIGASSEQDAEVRTIAKEIDNEEGCRAAPWNRGSLFTAGAYTMEKLIQITQQVDAALFVFGADDKVEYRNENMYQPRDNVLIEYGLFLGQLGKRNVAFYRNGDTRTARDVDGVTYINAPNGWNGDVRKDLRAWLQKAQQREMSGRLEKIMAPAIEFRIRFPNGKRRDTRPDPILTDLNFKAKALFEIEAEDQYLGEKTALLMEELHDSIDPPEEYWNDLIADQQGVYERIRLGKAARAHVAMQLNSRHHTYPNRLFVPLLADRKEQERLDENTEEICTVVYLDVGQLPRHVFGDQIWKDVSKGFRLKQLASEFEKIAEQLEASEERLSKLREAAEELRKGGGTRVMELCSEVGLFSMLKYAPSGSEVKKFLESLVDPFEDAESSS
jgi:Predicted nucleotide-binding protein containing TIR-like domain